LLAENELKSLLGYSSTNAWNQQLLPTDPLFVLPEAFDLLQSWQSGSSARPDVAQMRQDVEKSEIDLKYRRNQLFPSLDFVAGYGRKGASTEQAPPPLQASASLSDAFDQISDAAAPNDLLGIIFSVPLGRAAERGNYRSSKLLKEQAILRLKQREEFALREIADALFIAKTNLERVSLARRAREFAERALEAEEQKLAGGKSTVFFVLQLQGDVANAASTEIRAKADYNKALSQLNFADATLLEKRGIQVKFE
jgi:outer membrane protein TolC